MRILAILCLSPFLIAADPLLRVPLPPPLPAADSPLAQAAVARGLRSVGARDRRSSANLAVTRPAMNKQAVERARDSLRADLETQVQAARDAAAAAAAASGACAT